jgi:hypothetical protein
MLDWLGQNEPLPEPSIPLSRNACNASDPGRSPRRWGAQPRRIREATQGIPSRGRERMDMLILIAAVPAALTVFVVVAFVALRAAVSQLPPVFPESDT